MSTVKVYIYRSRDIQGRGKFATLEPLQNIDLYTTDFIKSADYQLPADYYVANDFGGSPAIFKDTEQYGKTFGYAHNLVVVNNAVGIETAPKNYLFLKKAA